MAINCYVINLEKDTHRLESIKKQFKGKEHIAKLHIIKAILGTESQEVEKIYQTKQNEMMQNYGLILTKGEIACFLSHQKALQTFVESGTELGIILEDDAILTPLFWNKIEELTNHYQNNLQNTLLNLRPHKHKKWFLIQKFEEYSIVKHLRVASGAVAYIVSQYVAREIIKEEPILSYDKMLQRFWHRKFINYATVPNFVEIMNTESTICVNGGSSRKQHRKVSKQKVGFLKYKMLRLIITIKHDFADTKFNIKKFGFLKTVKLWIS